MANLSYESYLRVINRMDAEFKAVMTEDDCMYPGCDSAAEAIDAHTIQRANVLESIQRDRHVMSFWRKPQRGIWPAVKRQFKKFGDLPELIGMNDMSTARIFCAKHDQDVFRAIDAKEYEASPEEHFLYSYRAFCREIYVKCRQARVFPTFKEVRSVDPDANEANYRSVVKMYERSTQHAVNHMTLLQNEYNRCLISRDFGSFEHFVIRFSRNPTLVCSSTFCPETDFHGGILQDMLDLVGRQDQLTICLFPAGSGGVCLLSWLKAYPSAPMRLCGSYQMLPVKDRTNAIVRLIFQHCENMAWSPSWWDSLNGEVRTALVQRFNSTAAFELCHPTSLLPDGCHYDDWGFTGMSYC